MFVTFSWPQARYHWTSAEVIALKIKHSGRMEDLLTPLTHETDVDPDFGICEVLQMEIRGLSSNLYLMPIWGLYNVSMWQKIEDAVDLLREFIGVEPRVLINGNQTVMSYAAQEEYRARRFREALDEATEALNNTRRWLKDPRVAEIRRRIERQVEDADKGAVFVGLQKVLVEAKK